MKIEMSKTTAQVVERTQLSGCVSSLLKVIRQPKASAVGGDRKPLALSFQLVWSLESKIPSYSLDLHARCSEPVSVDDNISKTIDSIESDTVTIQLEIMFISSHVPIHQLTILTAVLLLQY